MILRQIDAQLPDHDDELDAAAGQPVSAVGGLVERQLVGGGTALTEQETQPVRAPEDPQLCLAASIIQISFEFLGKEVLIISLPLHFPPFPLSFK